MVWLKRHEQVQLGHAALVCVMDSLLKLKEGITLHLHPHPHPLLMLMEPFSRNPRVTLPHTFFA